MKFNHELLNKCKEGNKEAINRALSAAGAIYRINGIFNAVIHKVTADDTVSIIKSLKTDDIEVSGYSVGQIALAALDVLNIEHYSGDDKKVHALIASKFAFLIS